MEQRQIGQQAIIRPEVIHRHGPAHPGLHIGAKHGFRRAGGAGGEDDEIGIPGLYRGIGFDQISSVCV
ncbi:hypothetical protein D3C83_171730 [compost metagenome]